MTSVRAPDAEQAPRTGDERRGHRRGVRLKPRTVITPLLAVSGKLQLCFRCKISRLTYVFPKRVEG